MGFLTHRIIMFSYFTILQMSTYGQILTRDSVFVPRYHLNYEHSFIDNWLKDTLMPNVNINSTIPYHFNEVNNQFYNRFLAYYKLVPDDPRDIIYPFWEAFRNDKDDFCHSFITIIAKNKADTSLFHRRKNIFKQNDQMASTCAFVLNSYNPNLIKRLETIKENDQKYRSKTNLVSKEQLKLDSINKGELLSIYTTYGYPNRKIVGVNHEGYFALALLHTDLETMEFFEPLVKNEVVKGNLSPTYYPNLYDRIQMIKGLKQEFGTQYVVGSDGHLKLYKHIGINQVNLNRQKYGLKNINQ